MANDFTISGDFGDTFIRISKEGKVALIFGEDDLSLTEEKSWQNTESYKTAVLFSLMIDSFIKNGKALDDLILNSPTGSIPAELIGKGYVDIELAGAGFEEDGVRYSFTHYNNIGGDGGADFNMLSVAYLF